MAPSRSPQGLLRGHPRLLLAALILAALIFAAAGAAAAWSPGASDGYRPARLARNVLQLADMERESRSCSDAGIGVNVEGCGDQRRLENGDDPGTTEGEGSDEDKTVLSAVVPIGFIIVSVIVGSGFFYYRRNPERVRATLCKWRRWVPCCRGGQCPHPDPSSRTSQRMEQPGKPPASPENWNDVVGDRPSAVPYIHWYPPPQNHLQLNTQPLDLAPGLPPANRLPVPPMMQTPVPEMGNQQPPESPFEHGLVSDSHREDTGTSVRGGRAPLVDSRPAPKAPGRPPHLATCPSLNYDIRVRPLHTVLGAGAFGSVEKGIFTDNAGRLQEVAVKYATGMFGKSRTPQEVVALFRQELDVFCLVPRHPNVVHCYGGRVVFEEGQEIRDRDVYIVEELMYGNLDDVIYSDAFSVSLPVSLILRIALDIASGLRHLHQSNVIHHDLKPANVLVDEYHHAKIADFGVSKIKMESYVTGSVRGTLGYMAPEVAILLYDPSVKISVKVDIYSLGVVMWEMVERKKIKLEAASFSGQEPSTDMDESWSPGSRFTFTNPCPGPLKDLILKCVEMQPKERPQAGEVCQEIQRIQRMFSAGQEANT